MWREGRKREVVGEGVRKRRQCGGRVDGERVGDNYYKKKRVLKEGGGDEGSMRSERE
jgi:hypothetical protein